MRFRHFLGFGVVALLAGFAASAAFAQFQPPPPAYPPGGYRGAPNQGSVIAEDDLDDIEARAPAGTAYPADPRAGRETAYEPRPYDPRPYDPRYGREVGR